MRRFGPALSCLVVLVIAFSSIASTPTSGTLNAPATAGQSTSVSWGGGPYTGATADPSACTSVTCDSYALNVNVPATFYSANPNYSVQVAINWSSNTNDFDLYVKDGSGNVMCSSGQSMTTSEAADCGQLPSGAYTVQVVAFATANATYSGTATLAPEPVSPVGKARYKNGNFSFSNPLTLPGPPDVAFNLQGIEPRVKTDALGNLYAAAIQGIPAGTDAWKSMDGGNSWTYLGQPDGAQVAAASGGRGLGLGGGDEDLAIAPNGTVSINSLWLGSLTQSVSKDGGHTWLVNPVSSNIPEDDRQWIATHGNNEVYLTYKQTGALLTGTESVIALKSFDGGLTFPQTTLVTTPEMGVQPGDQGNIEVDPNNGNVYTVFFGSDGKTLYIARSTDGGKTWIVKLVYTATSSLVNVFPSVAIDNASNVYIVYSDSHNVFLTVSKDQAASWSVPVRVSNGSASKSAIGPWITAGDAGKVNITWWGTTAASNNDPTAQWKVFFAQSLNATQAIPTFSQSTITGVMHAGAICTNGTGCASGTRNLAEYFAPGVSLNGSELIVYSDDFNNANPVATFIKQTGGSRLLK
jgi:hypothetical protein